MDDLELEALQKRVQQKMLADQLQDSPDPNGDLGLRLATGFIDLASKQSQGSLDAVDAATGLKSARTMGTTDATGAYQRAIAARQTATRQKALDDANTVGQIQKMIDAKREREDKLKADKRANFLAGVQEAGDGGYSYTPGGAAELGIAEKNAQIAKTKAEADAMPFDRKLKRDLTAAQIRALDTKTDKQSGPGAGKILPAGQAETAGGADAATAALQDINGLVDSNETMFGPVAGRINEYGGKFGLSNNSASINASLLQRAQIIGKYLEGGKLTDSDIARYQNALPKLSDPPEVARAKVQSLSRLVEQKKQAELAALQGAGYNTGGIKRNQLQALPNSGAQTDSVRMMAPDGTVRLVPSDQVAAARAAGGQVL